MTKFKTRKVKPNLSLEHTVKRIAQIACGTKYDPRPFGTGDDECQEPWLKENGSWVLSGGNNWFLRLESEDKEYRYWSINYRYLTEARQECLDGMCRFLEWTLGDI